MLSISCFLLHIYLQTTKLYCHNISVHIHKSPTSSPSTNPRTTKLDSRPNSLPPWPSSQPFPRSVVTASVLNSCREPHLPITPTPTHHHPPNIPHNGRQGVSTPRQPLLLVLLQGRRLRHSRLLPWQLPLRQVPLMSLLLPAVPPSLPVPPNWALCRWPGQHMQVFCSLHAENSLTGRNMEISDRLSHSLSHNKGPSDVSHRQHCSSAYR